MTELSEIPNFSEEELAALAAARRAGSDAADEQFVRRIRDISPTDDIEIPSEIEQNESLRFEFTLSRMLRTAGLQSGKEKPSPSVEERVLRESA